MRTSDAPRRVVHEQTFGYHVAVDRHRVENLRRSLAMAEGSVEPLSSEQAAELLAAVQAAKADLRRLREGLRALLDDEG
jgi:hypothetical protein